MSKGAHNSITKTHRLLIFMAILIVFFSLDRIVKSLFYISEQSFSNGTFTRAQLMSLDISVIPHVLSIRYVENTGVAFGMANTVAPLFFALFAVAVVAVLLYKLMSATDISFLTCLGFSLVASGALGNAFDRLAYGFVIDYISFEFIHFPVFNLADIWITVGVCLALIGIFVTQPTAKGDSE